MGLARVEVITGCMYAGKTEELLRRVRRAKVAGKSVLAFKHSLDERYGRDEICSHGNLCIGAIPADSIYDLYHQWDVITTKSGWVNVLVIDEVQFFDDGPEDVLRKVRSLARYPNVERIILAGTDMDFRGLPFGPMGHLMAAADDVTKLTAVCVQCGGKATRNQRLIDGKPAGVMEPVVKVGGKNMYEARCVDCHEVPFRR